MCPRAFTSARTRRQYAHGLRDPSAVVSEPINLCRFARSCQRQKTQKSPTELQKKVLPLDQRFRRFRERNCRVHRGVSQRENLAQQAAGLLAPWPGPACRPKSEGRRRVGGKSRKAEQIGC